MRLALLTFGDHLDTYSQAAFCLLSFLKADPTLRATVVTDRPQTLRHFGAHVTPLAIDAAQLAEWQQPTGFFWRVKIRALQEVVASAPGEDILYVDSDTILAHGLDALKQRLAEGRTLMHLPEQALSADPSKTGRQMWRTLAGQRIEGLGIDRNTVMWNAGVIGLPAAKAAATLDHTLRLCDALCATPARRRLLEQLAFSMALEASGPLHDARREVLHYWGNKAGWQPAMNRFWLRSRLAGHTLADDIAAFDVADYLALPVVAKATRWQRWLQARLASAKPRGVEFFPA
jgi:hypothetical protein